ncbi:uncharacterized protein HRG_10184 [Hirsutella rhossiliensis]|uniref:Uncharacterized protein n=1 Tax=Hirsutella rhossiliensis TaxID=111463 RepID=A0A9P8MSP9_9HYPO|nr:uncharacterized protein HRG_10184 [Hirsutella rhossiliensis]KAH0958497.1 hypothetical protein HRG_10184 [Hirsutella rhossiliensis]
MTMMFFAQPDCPVRFAHQDEHRYAPPGGGDDNDVSPLFFSLNLSIYGQPVVDSDWSEQWFFMSGRVHPYALAWEVERRDGLEADVGETLLYTMPALVVRDQGYQPVLPRSLAPDGHFPSTPPVVSFHGVVAGSGLDLLQADLLPGLPPFQVFVIFPIYANPWLVAGLLDHGVMCVPPGSDRDYVFVVVPDSWTFHDRSSAAAASASPLAQPLRRQPSSTSSAFDLVRAASYSLATPPSTAPHTPSKAPGPPADAPVTPPPKRACSAVADSPIKRSRTLHQHHSLPSSSSSTVGSAATSSSPPQSASSSRPPGDTPAHALAAAPGSLLDSIVASTSDAPIRPLRQRMQK